MNEREFVFVEPPTPISGIEITCLCHNNVFKCENCGIKNNHHYSKCKECHAPNPQMPKGTKIKK